MVRGRHVDGTGGLPAAPWCRGGGRADGGDGEKPGGGILRDEPTAARSAQSTPSGVRRNRGSPDQSPIASQDICGPPPRSVIALGNLSRWAVRRRSCRAVADPRRSPGCIWHRVGSTLGGLGR